MRSSKILGYVLLWLIFVLSCWGAIDSAFGVFVGTKTGEIKYHLMQLVVSIAVVLRFPFVAFPDIKNAYKISVMPSEQTSSSTNFVSKNAYGSLNTAFNTTKFKPLLFQAA